MAPKHEGPFEIEDVLGPVTYQLKLPESWKFTKSSMPLSYVHTEKTKSIGKIIHDHYRTLKVEKKSTKSNRS